MPLDTTVLLVDDHAAVRTGYRRFIEMEHDLRVVHEASNAEQAVAWLNTNQVDLAIMDISMPGQSGLELIRRVRLKWPELPIVILTMHDSPVVASKALEQGAMGYVTKSSPPEELINALRRVLSGVRHVSSDLAAEVTHRPKATGSAPPLTDDVPQGGVAPGGLSPREVDIVRMLAEGRTIEQTAESLGISSKTVSNNLSQIRQKLGVQTDFELAFWAWSQGVARKPPSLPGQHA